ncbi:MAG TPA: hypothetical protein GX723_03390 [Thermoanaerobacterales bacterium]|nr:hypothetical protein [Thermoanaerobacterales bacterium]
MEPEVTSLVNYIKNIGCIHGLSIVKFGIKISVVAAIQNKKKQLSKQGENTLGIKVKQIIGNETFWPSPAARRYLL